MSTDLDEQAEKHNRWVAHMTLNTDGTDPPDISVRAVEGLEGLEYLSDSRLTRGFTTIFGKVTTTLRHSNSISTTNLHVLTCDILRHDGVCPSGNTDMRNGTVRG